MKSKESAFKEIAETHESRKMRHNEVMWDYEELC